MQDRSSGIHTFECSQDNWDKNVFHFWERCKTKLSINVVIAYLSVFLDHFPCSSCCLPCLRVPVAAGIRQQALPTQPTGGGGIVGLKGRHNWYFRLHLDVILTTGSQCSAALAAVCCVMRTSRFMTCVPSAPYAGMNLIVTWGRTTRVTSTQLS